MKNVNFIKLPHLKRHNGRSAKCSDAGKLVLALKLFINFIKLMIPVQLTYDEKI